MNVLILLKSLRCSLSCWLSALMWPLLIYSFVSVVFVFKAFAIANVPLSPILLYVKSIYVSVLFVSKAFAITPSSSILLS